MNDQPATRATGDTFPQVVPNLCTEDVDLDLLAHDIADMLDENGYPIDAAASHIRAALPAFLAQVRHNAGTGQ